VSGRVRSARGALGRRREGSPLRVRRRCAARKRGFAHACAAPRHGTGGAHRAHTPQAHLRPACTAARAASPRSAAHSLQPTPQPCPKQRQAANSRRCAWRPGAAAHGGANPQRRQCPAPRAAQPASRQQREETAAAASCLPFELLQVSPSRGRGRDLPGLRAAPRAAKCKSLHLPVLCRVAIVCTNSSSCLAPLALRAPARGRLRNERCCRRRR
jgi:hypothetical protein